MPAGATYEPIATTTLSSGSGTIDFTSIPGTYTDLKLVLSALSTATTTRVYCRVNSNTGSNYSLTLLTGSGAAASSFILSSQTFWNLTYSTANGVSTTNPDLLIFDFFSYAGSTNKTVLVSTANDNNGSGEVQRNVCLWAQTTAITSINLYTSANQFATGTTATLYGIKAA